MTPRIPKLGTGSAWSARYWNPPEHPAVSLPLSLRPATRRWLFGVPGAGVGFYWTLPSMAVTRDTGAEWESGSRSLATYAATGDWNATSLPDNADVDRALWLPWNPWAVLEALGGHETSLTLWDFRDEHYFAKVDEHHAAGWTANEAVLRLADQIIALMEGARESADLEALGESQCPGFTPKEPSR